LLKIGKRLLTGQKWESAIRAGTTSSYYWGNNNPNEYAWHKKNFGKQTHDVRSNKSNSLGFYDMARNIWEWTQNEHEQSGKVVHGGSWRNGVGSLKSSPRIVSLFIHKFHYLGFRCTASK
jgi:formylglycine-generating enzyme required for sulfatase activity